MPLLRDRGGQLIERAAHRTEKYNSFVGRKIVSQEMHALRRSLAIQRDQMPSLSLVEPSLEVGPPQFTTTVELVNRLATEEYAAAARASESDDNWLTTGDLQLNAVDQRRRHT